MPEKHYTKASLHSDTVEDLIRISVEGSSLEDVDARESVASWFSQGRRSKRTNYRSWPSEGHVTAMECNVHKTLSHEMFSLKPLNTSLRFFFFFFFFTLRCFKFKS